MNLIYEIPNHPNALNDVDRQRGLKRLMVRTCTAFGVENFANEWSTWLSDRKLSIQDEDLKSWILEWSRKGTAAMKQMWETFLKAHVDSLLISTKTTTHRHEKSF